MRTIFLLLLLSVVAVAPLRAQTQKSVLDRDLVEEIGKVVRLSSEQEDRLAALHGTMLLKTEDLSDSLGPVVEKRLAARLKTKYAKELAAVDSAPAAERDARSRALVRKVAVELRTDVEKEALGQRRVVVTDFFADAARILKLSQRPKLKNFQTRYLAAWNRETLLELRKQLDLIIGSREPTKRP